MPFCWSVIAHLAIFCVLCSVGSYHHRWSSHVIHNKWPQVYFPFNLRDFHSIYIWPVISQSPLHQYIYSCARCESGSIDAMHSSDIAQQRLIFSRTECFLNGVTVFLWTNQHTTCTHQTLSLLSTLWCRVINQCVQHLCLSLRVSDSPQWLYEFDLRESEETFRICCTDHRWVS